MLLNLEQNTQYKILIQYTNKLSIVIRILCFIVSLETRLGFS